MLLLKKARDTLIAAHDKDFIKVYIMYRIFIALGIAEQNYFYYYGHDMFLPKVYFFTNFSKYAKLSDPYLINPFTKLRKTLWDKIRDLVTKEEPCCF